MLDTWFEKWFDKLKEIFKFENCFNNLLTINIKSNNYSKPFEYNKETQVISLNYKKLPYTEINEIREILKGAQNEGTTFLLKESQELIKDIKLKEESGDVKPLLEYFITKIPPADYNALRSAIYIDTLFKEGRNSQDIYRLKGDVGRKYGGRGLKICNLYASGYFETMIKPLYEEFSQRGYDKRDFINKYNIIINEEAFAVFIRSNMNDIEVKTTIKNKMSRNLGYGRRDITIHGIGRYNVEKIRKAISDIEEENEYPNIEKHIEETGSIILAKLSF
ncbi:MAG: hypothetical protein OIN85_04955 [Candidatus Methanoperedens sp.]|nr:hypothetical protein [Candidatus Methanoperedens sp.]